MRPIDLDDVAPVEPDESVRTVVYQRSRMLQRRRTARRWTSGAAVVIVLTLVAGIEWARSGTTHTRVTVEAPTIATATQSHALSSTLIGHWRPISMAGYGGPLTSPPLTSAPVLVFDNATEWGGSDGCNSLAGSYRLDADGAFHGTPVMQTLMACVRTVPTGEVVHSAVRVEVLDDQLMLYSRNGRMLARFERVRTTASDSTTGGTTQAPNTPTSTATTASTSAETAIRDAFLGWMNAQPHDAADPYVENFASIVEAVRRGMAQHSAEDLARYSGRVDSIEIVDASHASVRYTILFDGRPEFANQPGDAVKTDGNWKVSRDTVCNLLTLGGITCSP